MKEYYLERLHWIFRYTSKNFWYCLGKTLCLIVGVPIYAVSFVLEMVLTFVNMIFSWIPVLNVVVMFICKCLITVFGGTFYICILTDLKSYRQCHSDAVQYEIDDADCQPSEALEQQSDGEQPHRISEQFEEENSDKNPDERI